GTPWARRASALADSGLKSSGGAGAAKTPGMLVDVVGLDVPVDVDRGQGITETSEVKPVTVAPKRKRIVLIGAVGCGDIDLRIRRSDPENDEVENFCLEDAWRRAGLLERKPPTVRRCVAARELFFFSINEILNNPHQAGKRSRTSSVSIHGSG
ncbi:MAG: hypothetical protein ACRDRU_28145, partial [Pseudonocardiaceae bacterium]